MEIPKEKIKEMNQEKCIWQGCKESQFMRMSIQLVKEENGKIAPVKNVSVPMPMCNFHFIFGKYCVAKEAGNGNHDVIGPWDAVNISEEAIAAMILSGRFDKLVLAKKQAEVQANVKIKADNAKPEAIKQSDSDGHKQCDQVQQ